MATFYEKFAKSWHSILLRYPGVENFDKIALSPMVKEMEAILSFGTFWKIFSELGIVYSLDTLGVENFDEIALSPTVKEIEAILCFGTFSKNSKIQNGRHF